MRQYRCLCKRMRGGEGTYLDWKHIGKETQKPTETDCGQFDPLLFEMLGN